MSNQFVALCKQSMGDINHLRDGQQLTIDYFHFQGGVFIYLFVLSSYTRRV